VEFDLGFGGDLAIDAGLSMLFFVQHSWMVRRSSKQRLARIMPKHFLDAVYAIASGIALLAVVLLWQEADRLLFNVLWTIWIVIGTVLEERDLTSDFGNDYREYQRNVPMLLPTKIPD
jgi:hypothetical protein